MSNSSAAIVIIGNEILSGRTLDTNTQYIAKHLSDYGIDLIETRTIRDNHAMIVDTVTNLKQKYQYVFTTGGIGPTHDDITILAIADVFDLPLERNEKAYNTIKNFYNSQGKELNAAREKMAYLPQSCELIDNPISWAPGFKLENVYVLAGVPNIMQAMFSHVLPKLSKGKPVKSMQIEISVGESSIAAEFEILQNKYPEVTMGSYPFEINDAPATTLVLRSIDDDKLQQAYLELKNIIAEII